MKNKIFFSLLPTIIIIVIACSACTNKSNESNNNKVTGNVSEYITYEQLTEDYSLENTESDECVVLRI